MTANDRPCQTGSRDFALQTQLTDDCAKVEMTCGSVVSQSASDVHTDLGQISLARLDYVDIDIQGRAGTLKALSDSGSQLNVIISLLIAPLGLSPIGNISIRGIIGTPIITPLVVLHIDCIHNKVTV